MKSPEKRKRKDGRSRTSAANGDRGGRPKKQRDVTEFLVLGDPPLGDQIALAEWTQAVLVTDLNRIIKGRGDPVLSREIRATCGKMAGITPYAALAAAKRLVTDEEKSRKAQDAPEVEPVEVVEGFIRGAPARGR